MRGSALSFAAVIAVLGGVAGCATMFVQEPGITGAVIDSITRQGVDDATVSLRTHTIQGNEVAVSTRTDAQGKFRIAGKSQSGTYVLMMDVYTFDVDVHVSASNYEDAKRVVRISSLAREETNIGSIEMRPLP